MILSKQKLAKYLSLLPFLFNITLGLNIRLNVSFKNLLIQSRMIDSICVICLM